MQLYDGRPNGEMVLATGTLDAENPADHLTMQVASKGLESGFSRTLRRLETCWS